jgi:microcystin-dependent protein
MADPFVAEIRIYPFNFAPRGWAFCNGQLLPISQNTALFSLLGTTYGGDGKTIFALPDLQERTPMHPGQGPGLSLHDLSGGSAAVTLTPEQMPQHTHTLTASQADALSQTPLNELYATGTGIGAYAVPGNQTTLTTLSPEAVTVAGAGLPHNNMMPFLTLNFCIALQGVFPPRG